MAGGGIHHLRASGPLASLLIATKSGLKMVKRCDELLLVQLDTVV